MKKVVNLTPHVVRVNNKEGGSLVYDVSGHVARSFSKYEKIESINGAIVKEERKPIIDFDGVVIRDNVDYIVSWQFAMKLKFINFSKLSNFLYPLSYKGYKENGKIVSVPCLVRLS